MARPHRNLITHDRFHVINRGIDGQDLFSISDDWVLFESLLGTACTEHDFRVNAYALMSSHFHVLVDLTDTEDRAGVSTAFGVLQSTYSKYFNERTGRRGPLFEPRFLAFGVEGESKFHRVVRYIHRNPIDICGPRALAAYRWSSLPVLLGRRTAPAWLDCSLLMPQHPEWHLADLAGCTVDDLRPLDALPPQRRVSIDAIEAVSTTPDLDHRAQKRISIGLAIDLRAADVVTVAEHFGCTTTYVRRVASMNRSRARTDPTLANLIDAIRRLLAT